MTTYGEVEVLLPSILTSILDEGEWPASSPDRFPSGEKASSTHWIGGWVGLRAGLATVE
jgi:hypothetical protein